LLQPLRNTGFIPEQPVLPLHALQSQAPIMLCMAGEPMKLPLISISIVAYTVLAAAWICYAELASVFKAGAPF
jgi:hypothetical protein